MTQIGDILAKLGRNEALTNAEQQKIRLWGNNTEQNNTFVTGLQNGRSSINASDVEAQRMYVGKEILSGTAARFYEIGLSVPTSTYTGNAAWSATYADAGFTTIFTTGQDNVVIPETGIYQITVQAFWDNSVSGSGIRDSGLSQNDVGVSPQNNANVATGAAVTYLYGLSEREFSKGDEVHVTHWQNSGSTITVSTVLGLRKIR